MKRKRINIGEILMAKHLDELDIDYSRQEPVCEGRRWRWDFYLGAHAIAIEVDGFHRGKHGKGYGADYEKQNYGTMQGIRVLRFTTKEVKFAKDKEFLAGWLKEGAA